jgi:hypothetical protein
MSSSSADTRPISPTRFAAALQELSLTTLRLKHLEVRNSIAHLESSNEQLRPFAEGAAVALGRAREEGGGAGAGAGPSSSTRAITPDQDCIDAIRENEVVIARMLERVDIIRCEVQSRGHDWAEFQRMPLLPARRRASDAAEEGGAARDNDDESETAAASARNPPPLTNGHPHPPEQRNGTMQRHAAWTDGTFQTGTVRNGRLEMDHEMDPFAPPSSAADAHSTDELRRQRDAAQERQGGRLDDDALARAMADRMRELEGGDADDGMHL